MCMLYHLSNAFSCSSNVTLPKIRKGLVRVTFPSHLQYINGSLSKSLISLKVYFRAVVDTLLVGVFFGELNNISPRGRDNFKTACLWQIH